VSVGSELDWGAVVVALLGAVELAFGVSDVLGVVGSGWD
jgi:hypothetical protein